MEKDMMGVKQWLFYVDSKMCRYLNTGNKLPAKGDTGDLNKKKLL